jgi:hypothetical protein
MELASSGCEVGVHLLFLPMSLILLQKIAFLCHFQSKFNGRLLGGYGDMGIDDNALAFLVGGRVLADGAVRLRERLLLSRSSQSDW